MKIYVCLAAIAIAFAISAGAAASTHTIIVENPGGVRISGISVIGAKVIGFEPTEAKQFPLTVELPDDGVCNPIVRVRFRDGTKIDGRVSMCQNGGFTITDD